MTSASVLSQFRLLFSSFRYASALPRSHTRVTIKNIFAIWVLAIERHSLMSNTVQDSHPPRRKPRAAQPETCQFAKKIIPLCALKVHDDRLSLLPAIGRSPIKDDLGTLIVMEFGFAVQSMRRGGYRNTTRTRTLSSVVGPR